MILSFKPMFVQKILDGRKIHTIREDKTNRWKEGIKMHFATGIRTKNYKQFAESYCVIIEKIEIEGEYKVLVNGYRLSIRELGRLAENDGFDSIKDFFRWFDKPFKGKIIYWDNV